MTKVIIREIDKGWQWTHPDKIQFVKVIYQNANGPKSKFYNLKRIENTFDFTPSEEELRDYKNKIRIINNRKLIEKECYHYITTVAKSDIKSPKDAALRKLQEYVMANSYVVSQFESLEFKILRKR